MSQDKAEPTAVPPRNPRRNLSSPASRENEADHSLRELVELLRLGEDVDTPRAPVPDKQTSLHREASSASRVRNRQTSEEILITHLDHVIASHGGKTASIERLPGQISRFKNVSFSPQEELVELKRENSRLRAELAYHEKVRHVLMALYAKTVELYKGSSRMMDKLHEAVQSSSQGLATAERDLLAYWGISTETANKNSEDQEDNFF